MRLTALKTASSSDLKHQIAFLATTAALGTGTELGKLFIQSLRPGQISPELGVEQGLIHDRPVTWHQVTV